MRTWTETYREWWLDDGVGISRKQHDQKFDRCLDCGGNVNMGEHGYLRCYFGG